MNVEINIDKNKNNLSKELMKKINDAEALCNTCEYLRTYYGSSCAMPNERPRPIDLRHCQMGYTVDIQSDPRCSGYKKRRSIVNGLTWNREIVISETNEDRIFLTTVEAMKLLNKKDGSVHVYTPMGNIMMGSDIELEHVEAIFNDAYTIEIAGENAMKSGHGIVVIDKEGILSFWEHNPETMEELTNE